MAAALFLVSDSSFYAVWGIVLAVAVVIVLVLATLLLLIGAAARAIEREAGRCLTAAEKIAANTASIWAIEEVNAVATNIEITTQSIERNGGEIAEALSGRVRTQ